MATVGYWSNRTENPSPAMVTTSEPMQRSVSNPVKLAQPAMEIAVQPIGKDLLSRTAGFHVSGILDSSCDPDG